MGDQYEWELKVRDGREGSTENRVHDDRVRLEWSPDDVDDNPGRHREEDDPWEDRGRDMSGRPHRSSFGSSALRRGPPNEVGPTIGTCWVYRPSSHEPILLVVVIRCQP